MSQPKNASPHARFIPREELGSFAAWTPGRLNADPAEAPAAAADDAALQARVAAARQSGYQDGYRDGLVALDSFKQSFAAQMAAQLGRLFDSFDAALESLEPQMAQALADAAVQLARRVVRAELGARPEVVAEAAQQAVQAVLLSARHIRVRVHPDDLPLVAQGAADALAARGARLDADADIERGGCVVESDLGTVDARIASRWRQAAQVLGSTLPWDAHATTSPAAAAPPQAAG